MSPWLCLHCLRVSFCCSKATSVLAHGIAPLRRAGWIAASVLRDLDEHSLVQRSCGVRKWLFSAKDHIYCVATHWFPCCCCVEIVDLLWSKKVLSLKSSSRKITWRSGLFKWQRELSWHCGDITSIVKNTPCETAECCVEQLAIVQGVMPHKMHVRLKAKGQLMCGAMPQV